MRWTDGGLQLAACGSSFRDMPTYGTWEYTVLDHCFEEVDYISLHQYFENYEDEVDRFLTVIDKLERFITEVAAIADAVDRKHGARDVHRVIEERVEHPLAQALLDGKRRRKALTVAIVGGKIRIA